MRVRERGPVRTGRVRGRGVTAALSALATLAALTGCGSGGDDRPGPEPSGAKRVLRLATASDVSQEPVRQNLIRAWDAARPDVEVEFVHLPTATDDARSQLVATLQGDKAAYDLVNMDVTWTAEFAAGELIRPLDGDPLEGMWEQVASTARYGEDVWAVPFNTDAALLYYRTDVWRDRDWKPPRTWRDLERAAAAATDGAQVTDVFEHGYATQLGEYEGLTVNTLESVWASGGELVEKKDGSATAYEVRAATPRTEAGLRNLADRYRRIMPPEVRRATELDTLRMFERGEVAFMRNWPYVYNVLNAKMAGKFGVVPLPGPKGRGASVLGGQNLAITAGSENAGPARELLDHLAAPEQQRCLLDGGFAPVLKASYEPEGPECSLTGSAAPGGGADGEGGETGGTGTAEAGQPGEAGEEAAEPGSEPGPGGLPPYTRALKEALGTARPRPVTPYYAAFTELVQTEVHPSLRQNPDEGTVASERLDKELRQVMEGG